MTKYIKSKIQQAVAAHQEGKLEEAEINYRKVLALNPDHIVAHGNLGSILLKLGRLEEAELSYKKAIKLNPEYSVAHNNLGSLLYDLGRLVQAEESFKKALEFKSDFVEGHYNLATILLNTGRLKEAEESYKKVIELKPEYAEAHHYLGRVQKNLNKLDEAEKNFRKAIELKPDYAEAHYNLGITLQTLNKLDEVEKNFRKAIELKPDYAEAHYNLGITLQTLNKLDEVEKNFRKAIELKPDYAEAHYNLGNTLNNFKKFEEAEKSYRKSINSFEKEIEINPSNYNAYRNISNIFLKIREFEKSYNYYVKFLQLESKGVISKAKLENIIPKFAKKMVEQDRIPTFFDQAVEYQLTHKNNSTYDYCEIFDKVQISKENRFILYSEKKKNNSNSSFNTRLFDGLPFKASQGLHSTIKWKENPLYKSAYDLIIYSMLLQEVKPDIIVELGSGLGGSAIWLADTAAALGLDTHVYSYDIKKPKTKHHKVTFIEYDLAKIDRQVKPPCWELFKGKKIIIEDAHVNLKNILYLFDAILKKNDYLIIEDSSTKQDIISNFSDAKEPKYKLDQFYIDFFGANVTSCINSIFKSQQD
jgi:tetratricopeptide (TPR) repeat protein